MRRDLAVLLLLSLFLTTQSASGEEDFSMKEDSSFQTDVRAYDILNISGDTFLGVLSYQENVTVTLVDGFLNFTAIGDWNGVAVIGYNYIEDATLVDGNWTLNVIPVNDAPVILGIVLSGDPSNLSNPVTYGVECTDVDGDELVISWFLGEDTAGEGASQTRYVFPDQNELTVIVDDGNGGIDSLTVEIHTIPPEGWGDEPDNTRNRLIFWFIFGSAGTIFLAASFWVMFMGGRKDRGSMIQQEDGNDPEREGSKEMGAGPNG
ncbi:MAG: hypothetical protein ACMUHY_06860 [Thermoplasmatota archaeon]